MSVIEQSAAAGENPTVAERSSDREFVVTRRFNAAPALVFAAWTQPALLRRWWCPQSFGVTFIACEADVRAGGRYRFEFGHPASEQPMAFFGRYLEVVPDARLVWTNEEGGENGAITTVTFEAREGGTLVTMREVHATKEKLDEVIASGATGGFAESFAQLDAVLAAG